MMRNPGIRRFTGWHMTGILVAFFAVVIAVNLLMATIAVRSFGGTVVDNSYVASQKFNGWLEHARAQERLGWRDKVDRSGGDHVDVTLTGPDGAALRGARIAGLAQHPLGRAADIALDFSEVAPGHYQSDRVVPAGRWRIALTVRRGKAEQRLLRALD
ncbi:nitrogen fixation protein FixH [Sphingobium sp. OAS761]|uniref:FixH family protein n=1 Tax=Sphingobium sp. OAS761 TaxID=2817901 RepID=UPI00209D00BD|nr:FixH family protein [Sphingobium sp. OAS761]MCP1472032.1 nitrogen fixation protein FixH [Sphingobium sp. OAS761]